MNRKRAGLLTTIAMLAIAATAIAAPSNGGFEKANFNGWERTEPGGGNWEIYDADDGAPSPPQLGDYAARTVQGGPGLNILHRKLNAKDGRYLSFYLAYDNTAVGAFSTPKSFRFNGEVDNQQARVDLLDKDAKIKSLKNSDILETVFRTKASSPLSSSYEFYFVDLKEEGIKGKFQFRVAEVDNVSGWFVGLDELFQSDLVP